jgi:hypothetical protein
MAIPAIQSLTMPGARLLPRARDLFGRRPASASGSVRPRRKPTSQPGAVALQSIVICACGYTTQRPVLREAAHDMPRTPIDGSGPHATRPRAPRLGCGSLICSYVAHSAPPNISNTRNELYPFHLRHEAPFRAHGHPSSDIQTLEPRRGFPGSQPGPSRPMLDKPR